MFRERSTAPEIMDDLNCKGEVVTQTLRELEIINKWLGGNQVTLSALDKCLTHLKRKKRNATIRIADLGCGGGDMLLQMARMAAQKNIPAALIGIDANSFIIDYARKNTENVPEIKVEKFDVLSDEFKKESFDIVNCTLFCHHFDDLTLTNFLSQLKNQTRTAIIINDIHRHWFAYHSIKWLTAVFSKSEMVKYDARISVLRAFRKKELEKIIKAAGFSKYSIEWKWAFRYEVIIWI